jgi:hypothetical protein
VARESPPDLSGVYLKLDRANTHIETLREMIRSFREGNPPPFGFRTEKTARPDKSVEYVLYAIVREAPPRELAPVIGDVIHNIRSALDHLVYELAPPKSRKSRKTQFPIFSDEREFKEKSPEMLAGITGNERTLIERVQPYNAMNPPRHDPLAILNKLSNLDKHRLLVPVVAAVSATDSWVASDNAEITWDFIAADPVAHDAKLVAFTAVPRDSSGDMVVDPSSGLQIELRDTGADDLGLDVVHLLEMIHYHVRHMVIGMWFERGYMLQTWAESQGLQEPPSSA